MNPLFTAAADAARFGWLMGVMTVIFLAIFIGWAWWAYSPRNKTLMDEMAQMPLRDGGNGEQRR